MLYAYCGIIALGQQYGKRPQLHPSFMTHNSHMVEKMEPPRFLSS